MGLNQEVRVFRRMASKTLDDIGSAGPHVWERRVIADLIITGKLQWEKKEWLIGKAIDHLLRLALAQRAGQIFPSPAQSFHERRAWPMSPVERISNTPGMNSDIVPRRVPEAPPEVRGNGGKIGLGWEPACLIKHPFLVTCQP